MGSCPMVQGPGLLMMVMLMMLRRDRAGKAGELRRKSWTCDIVAFQTNRDNVDKVRHQLGPLVRE